MVKEVRRGKKREKKKRSKRRKSVVVGVCGRGSGGGWQVGVLAAATQDWQTD